MRHDSILIAAFVLAGSAALLSGCGSESKDSAMGEIITECQMNAHGSLEGTELNDEKKHFALGEYVEKCLRRNGLEPLDDPSCAEAPQSAEDGKSFIKPIQKCWKSTKGSKG
jgi:hypothetical protein